MTIEQFIEDNRKQIDRVIEKHCGDNAPIRDDDEREDYIANIEELYLWAKEEGVDFEK